MTLEFSQQIFEKCLYVKFHEIPYRGYELFLADRRTTRHDKAVAFHNFANAPKIDKRLWTGYKGHKGRFSRIKARGKATR
jgi:hypothetical protein